MRLIDADKLLNNLKELGWLDDNPLDDIINEQLTAYDIEKVVNQLEELQGRYDTRDFAIIGILEKTIKLVKAGGMNE